MIQRVLQFRKRKRREQNSNRPANDVMKTYKIGDSRIYINQVICRIKMDTDSVFGGFLSLRDLRQKSLAELLGGQKASACGFTYSVKAQILLEVLIVQKRAGGL